MVAWDYSTNVNEVGQRCRETKTVPHANGRQIYLILGYVRRPASHRRGVIWTKRRTLMDGAKNTGGESGILPRRFRYLAVIPTLPR
jgi:hypothetical protein